MGVVRVGGDDGELRPWHYIDEGMKPKVGGASHLGETPGYEPFALHAPIQWAIQGHVIKKRGGLRT